MAMRSRGGGAAGPNRGGRMAGAVRPVFEDFRPVSEWQQDDESHILSIYLPGFMKEQIRVSTEGKNIIRVRGERLVAGNKWSRFLEDFQVPEKGEMNSIRAKFQGGVLSITVPKTSPKIPQEETLPPKTLTDDDTQKQPTPQKSQPTHEKSSEPQKAIDTPKQGLGEVLKQKDIVTPLGTVNLKEKLERLEDITGKMSGGERKNSEGSKRLPEGEVADQKGKFEKDGPAKTDKDKELKGTEISHSSAGATKMEKYKNAVKGLAEINEDRQLLLNMGVGVLVIMALSAYVAYNFATGKKDK